MQIETHPDGVTLDRPAIVIRGAKLALGSPADSAADGISSQVCPKCGQSGFNCCSYADKSELSEESLSLYRGMMSRDDDSTERTPLEPAPASGEEDQTTPHSSKETTSEADGLTANAVPPGEEPESTGEHSGNSSDHAPEEEAESSTPGATPDGELNEEEQQEVEQLQQRDREVRQHEQAHTAAAGHLAVGGPNFEYKSGPDGRRYATEGDVKIAVGSGNSPEEKARNAHQAERAALAPAEPSAQDRKVASEARKVAAEAEREITEKHASEAGSQSPASSSTSGSVEKPESDHGLEGAKQPDHEAKGSKPDESGTSSSSSPLTDSFGATASTPTGESQNSDPTDATANVFGRVADAYRQNSYATPQLARALDAEMFLGGLVHATA